MTVVNLSSTASCKAKAFGTQDLGLGTVKKQFGRSLASLRSSTASSAVDRLIVGRADASWLVTYPYTSTLQPVFSNRNAESGVYFAAPMAS